MVPLIYDILLLLTLLVLYVTGIGLKNNGGKIFSKPGISAILVYTLFEGLRYGRQVDYNLYGNLYDEVAKGYETNKDALFEYLLKFLISIDLPYQGLILLESFMFITGALFLLIHYREMLPLSLPFYALISMIDVENMIRWYIGFSLILIGCSYLLRKKRVKFLVYSIGGCLFHIGLLLFPLIFYLFSFIKKPLMHPVFTIVLFISIGLLFKTEMMLIFSDMINIFSFLSENGTQKYVENAEYWLTGGNSGRYSSPFPGISTMLFDFFVVWCGYPVVKKSKGVLVFPYNLFLIGFLLMPISRQIELLARFAAPLYFFVSLIGVAVIYYSFYYSIIKKTIPVMIFTFLLIYKCAKIFLVPFESNPKQYMFIWDHNKETYDSMIDMWSTESNNQASKAENNKSH